MAIIILCYLPHRGVVRLKKDTCLNSKMLQKSNIKNYYFLRVFFFYIFPPLKLTVSHYRLGYFVFLFLKCILPFNLCQIIVLLRAYIFSSLCNLLGLRIILFLFLIVRNILTNCYQRSCPVQPSLLQFSWLMW